MTKKTFVLVHSAWLGSWQWNGVREVLESMGHVVIAPDLPGHGDDKTPIESISMDGYVQTVVDILDQQDEAVILLGHSFNGVTVSRVAELRSEKVKTLVYLAGFLLPAGVSFFKAVEDVQGSRAVDNFYLSKDGKFAFVREEEMHEAFAHDIPGTVFTAAAPRIVPEPVAPLAYELEISAEKWGAVPKVYIECTEDKAVPIEVQRAMYKDKVQSVYTLNSSHTPNFSQPKQLAEILAQV